VTLQPTDEIKKRLQQHLDKHNLPLDPFDELVDQAILINYQAGTPVFLQGTSAEMLLLLVKGIARVYCPVEGERILARLAGPGDLLGQVNFLNGNGHRQLFEVHAATRCEVAVVGRESAFRVLQKLDKADLLRLLDAFNIIWSENLFWFVTLLGVSFRERLEIILTDLIKRFGVKEKRGILIVPELSQLDLAEMIGSSRPMISRLVKDMTESGELTRHDKQYIISDGAEWLRKNPLQRIFEAHSDGNGRSSGMQAISSPNRRALGTRIHSVRSARGNTTTRGI
jgi:CRP/FNR family transcriptional regulator, cyclic AMP receptor protein